MKTGPLNESELEWLDDILTKYNTDHAILDVAELTMCRAGRQRKR